MQTLDKYIVLDLETTGLDPKTGAEIMEFGAVKVKNGAIVEEYETLIKPKNNPPVEIEILTGIKAEDLQDAPDLEEVRTQIVEFIEDLPIIGHNINFDLDFLRHHDFDLPQQSVDTCALAATLITNASSFSLETLASYFALPEEEAHRAIGDVRTTQRLFEILRKLARQTKSETKTKILALGERLDWLPARVFEGESDEFTLPKQKSTQEQSLEIEIPESLPAQTLLSIPPHTETVALNKILEKYNQSTLVIARNSVEAGKLAQTHSQAGILFAPSSYLDQNKLNIFEQNLKSDEEIKLYFWLKIAIWAGQTKTGATHELIFQRNDYPLWLEIGADTQTSNFFAQALASAQNKPIIFSTLRSVFDTPEIFAHFENVLILGTEELDFRISQMAEQKIFSEKVIDFLQKHLPDENLLNSVDLFFGLAGAMVKNYTPESPYPVHEVMNTTTQFGAEYKRLQEASENLITKFEQANLPFLSECAQTLRSFFQINADIVSWITVYPNGNISLHANRIDLDNLLHQTLNLPERQNVIFLSEHFFSAVMSFLQEELGLGGYEVASAKSPARTSAMHFGLPEEEIPADSWQSEKNMQSYLEHQFAQNERSMIVIFSAKKILNQYFEHFYSHLNETGKMLLAEGRTGGVGKILNKFEDNPNAILFVSERTFRRVDFPKKDNLLILLHKLPFEWASPVNQARSKKYENDFMGFSLPQALLKFDKLVTKAGKLADIKGNFICLDRRIKEKKYGEEFGKILDYRDKN